MIDRDTLGCSGQRGSKNLRGFMNVYIQVLIMPKYSLDELRLIQGQTNKIKKR